jgi:hypothetical protein
MAHASACRVDPVEDVTWTADFKSAQGLSLAALAPLKRRAD